MSQSSSATRTFLIACCLIVVGVAGWRLLAPKSAQGPAPLAAQVIPEGPPCVVPFPRNIIVFETDDQRWDTLDKDIDPVTEGTQYAMPDVRDFFITGGVNFSNAFVTNPTCCPSRASQLSGGFYSHNTGVLTNTWPNGSAVRFEDENALAVRMKDTNYIDEAYYTVLIGKYMNGYEDLVVDNKKGRYIPPGWDLFIVVNDARDWDRDYPITVGGNPDGPGPVKGVILPKDSCKIVDNNCIDNWNSGAGGTLRADLVALNVPNGIIDLLELRFPCECDESQRVWTYLPELEKLLAVKVLENLPDPDAPLFMMLTMAPPHGPTQLSPEYCADEDDFIQAFQYDTDPRGGYGEGVSDYSDADISDKPSWMQGNPDAFVKQVACKSSLLHCFRGEGCDTQDCSGDGGTCDREEDPEDFRNYRALQRVFSDELASLHIIDAFIAEIKTAADTVTDNNTVYFYTADHGTMWGEHGSFQKGVPYEEVIRVPFAVAGKDIRFNVNDPIKINEMVAMDLDMPATILEIAGYTREEISDPTDTIKSDGCSLLGMLEAGAT